MVYNISSSIANHQVVDDDDGVLLLLPNLMMIIEAQKRFLGEAATHSNSRLGCHFSGSDQARSPTVIIPYTDITFATSSVLLASSIQHKESN